MVELISKTGLAGSKLELTTMESNIKLTSLLFDEDIGITNDEVLKDASLYQRLVRKLMFAIIVRRDISYVVYTKQVNADV